MVLQRGPSPNKITVTKTTNYTGEIIGQPSFWERAADSWLPC